MNPEDLGPTGGTGAEDQTERAIPGLADQEFQPSPDFLARVRRSIHRRTAVSHLTSYSWSLPKIVLTEMGGLLRHLFLVLGGKKES